MNVLHQGLEAMEDGRASSDTRTSGEESALLLAAASTATSASPVGDYGSSGGGSSVVRVSAAGRHPSDPRASPCACVPGDEFRRNIGTGVQLLQGILYNIVVAGILMWGTTLQCSKLIIAVVEIMCTYYPEAARAKCGEGVRLPQYHPTVYFAVSAILFCVHYAYCGVRACISHWR